VIDVGANSNVTIELGYQTTPVQMQVETKAIDLASLIPPEALNVEVYQEISNDSPLNPNPGFQITQEPAVINEPVGWTLSANGTFVSPPKGVVLTKLPKFYSISIPQVMAS